MLVSIEFLIEMSCWASRALEVRNRCFDNRTRNRNGLSSLQSSGGPKSMLLTLELVIEIGYRASRALQARNR